VVTPTSAPTLCSQAPKTSPELWRDVLHLEAVVDRANGTVKTPAELLEELLPTLVSAAGHHARFLAYIASSSTLRVSGDGLPPPPATPRGDSKRGAAHAVRVGLETYSQLLDAVPSACVGVPTVLFALREAVVAATDVLGGGRAGDASDAAHADAASARASYDDLRQWSVMTMGELDAAKEDDTDAVSDVAGDDVQLIPPVDATDESLVRLYRCAGVRTCRGVHALRVTCVCVSAQSQVGADAAVSSVGTACRRAVRHRR
jgi:hypothetical protein